jgi:hypothetical protein
MKNMLSFVFILAALVLLPNASVWEGAAAAAAPGDLPDEGYYAATNSFPRNTVVDIVNLETGKSIRVIVAAPLDSPGLLAVLSRDAAAGIGLQPRFIGRIRMTQPSDPIAFSRFTEGLATSGDPDYDPRAMLAADIAGGDTGDSPIATKAPPLAAERFPPSPEKQHLPSASLTQPSTGTAPGGESEDYPYRGYTIVDIPNAYPGPARPDEDPAPEPEAETKSITDGTPGEAPRSEGDWYDYWDYPAENNKSELAGMDEEDSPESTLYPIWARGGSVGVVDIPPELDPEPPKIAAAPVPVPARGTDPGAPYLPAEGTSSPGLDSGPYELTLIPAEKRPPEEYSDFNIPPEAIIGPIERQPPTPARTPSDYMDESLFIGPIERPVQVQAQPAEPYPSAPVVQYPPAVPQYPAPVVQMPPPEAEVLPPVFTEPIAELATPDEDPDFPEYSEFSVPLINELERGKYYLQIGAFSQPASVEDALTKIDKAFPLAVQAGGSAGNPLYRILVGPVNQGESGALLQRFKRGGYGDVFVKSN